MMLWIPAAKRATKPSTSDDRIRRITMDSMIMFMLTIKDRDTARPYF
jgi:hypothetical protein